MCKCAGACRHVYITHWIENHIKILSTIIKLLFHYNNESACSNQLKNVFMCPTSMSSINTCVALVTMVQNILVFLLSNWYPYAGFWKCREITARKYKVFILSEKSNCFDISKFLYCNASSFNLLEMDMLMYTLQR